MILIGLQDCSIGLIISEPKGEQSLLLGLSHRSETKMEEVRGGSVNCRLEA